jgi:hypothetical protein
MPARLEVRDNADDQPDGKATHEWVALVGGNGEVMMSTETYPAGHGNGQRSKERLEVVFTVHLDGRPI